MGRHAWLWCTAIWLAGCVPEEGVCVRVEGEIAAQHEELGAFTLSFADPLCVYPDDAGPVCEEAP